jgi:hypothetical protein
MPTIPHSLPNAHKPCPIEAELALIGAILRQAVRDLRDPCPHIQADACAFWRGDEGTLGWFCDLLGLNLQHVQRRNSNSNWRRHDSL